MMITVGYAVPNPLAGASASSISGPELVPEPATEVEPTGTCSAVPGSSKTWRALSAVDRAAWLRCGGGRVGAIDEAFEQGPQWAVVAGERGA